MLGILNILNKYFWKSITGPFFTFILGGLVMLASMALYNLPTLILGNALSVPIICMGSIVVPHTIFQFRQSVILKRIGVANIKPSMFIFITLIYFIVLMMISSTINLLISMIYIYGLYGNNNTTGKLSFFNAYNGVNYGSWIYSQLITIFLSLSLGMFFSSILHNTLAIQTIGLLVIIASLIFGGSLVPFSMIEDNKILRSLSYIVPFRYTTATNTETWFSNIQNILINSEFTFNHIDITDVEKAINKILSNNYMLGKYENNGNFISISINDAINNITKGCASLVNLTYLDINRGLIFETTLDQISKNSITLPATGSLFNFSKSNIWNIYDPFMQVKSTIGMSLNYNAPNIGTLWVLTDKILNLVLPYIFISIFTFIAIWQFKWNNRGT